MVAARGHQKCVWPEHAVPPEKFLELWHWTPCPETITRSWHKVQVLTRWNKRLSGWIGLGADADGEALPRTRQTRGQQFSCLALILLYFLADCQ